MEQQDKGSGGTAARPRGALWQGFLWAFFVLVLLPNLMLTLLAHLPVSEDAIEGVISTVLRWLEVLPSETGVRIGC